MWTPNQVKQQSVQIGIPIERPTNIVEVPVRVKRIHPLAKMPEYGHPTDSCFDIFAIERTEIPPDQFRRVRTGIVIQAPPDWDFQYFDKSGLASKGITVRAGTIDEGYTGELEVLVFNEGDLNYVVEPGKKITQVRLMPRYKARFIEVEDLDARDRGASGFGSTGLEAKQ